MPDNKGYVHVSAANHRYLVFDTGDPFFPAGENLPDQSHIFDDLSCYKWNYFYKRDFDNYMRTFEELHSVGANYVALHMRNSTFNPEWEHTGVYDDFGARGSIRSACFGIVDSNERGGNRQYNCWMLDQLMDKARQENIYIQFNVDPNTPTVAYQYMWGSHCYEHDFVYPDGDTSLTTNPFDFSRYFISSDFNSDSAWAKKGTMYYWKRKYKYTLSRWGYSTNIAMIETMREIDQTLGYGPFNTSVPDSGGWCPDNSHKYYDDFTHLKTVVRKWHDEMLPYIKNVLDNNGSGGFNHLCTVSYGGGDITPNHADMFTHPLIDVIDPHAYDDNQWMNRGRFDVVKMLNDSFPGKPVHNGECSTFGPSVTTRKLYGTDTVGYYSLTTTLNNYETSFHNMIWATSFNGCLQPGQTWQYNVVHWWPNSTPVPIRETNINPISTNALGGINLIKPALHQPINIVNKKTFDHFEPLVEFFKPSISGIDLANDVFFPKKIYDDPVDTLIECYYLLRDNGGGDNNHAYGWLHNREKYWRNHWYHSSTPVNGQPDENYFGCFYSPGSSFTLEGFDPNISNYEITFFPTYVSGQNLPTATCSTLTNGNVIVTMQNNLLGCGPVQDENGISVANADVAFVVHPHGQMRVTQKTNLIGLKKERHSFDFYVFPNPGNGIFTIDVPLNAEETYEVKLFDVAGRTLLNKAGQKGNFFTINLGDQAKGIYFVCIRKGDKLKFKKIILQ